MNETQLVAFYVSKLNSQSQVEIFASYLEHILENEPRKDALMHAEYNGLNIFATTKQVVENIRRKPHEVEACGELQVRIFLLLFILTRKISKTFSLWWRIVLMLNSRKLAFYAWVTNSGFYFFSYKLLDCIYLAWFVLVII